MGNIFSKKQVWKEELHMIKTELAALDKRKTKRFVYVNRTKFVFNCLLAAALIAAGILASFSFFYSALGLIICFVTLRLGIKFSVSGIFNYLAERDEAKIAKYCSEKERLVNEIKNKVAYNEAKSLLDGYDSEIDRINGAALNLEPLTY